MKNKKTIITMIVIFVTAVFVVVGTYAYFASSVDANGTSYLNTTLPAGSYNFTVTRAGELNMTFTSDQMMASGVSTDAIVNGNTDIEVQLLSSDNDSEVTCTYDLVWEWTSEDKYITSDATLPLTDEGVTYNYEYSVEASSTTTGSPSGTNYGSANTLNEKDLSKYTWSGNKATILSGAKITSKSSETPTITNWDIKANIYNIPVNQVNLLNKEFKATIKVDNVQCNFAGGSAPAGDSSFATDDWDTVIANLKSGNNSYEVGDIKCIELNGFETDGSNGCENGGFRVRLVNKSTPAECSTTGFSQTGCGNVIEFIDKPYFELEMDGSDSPYGTTEGGWAVSEVRKYITPVTGEEDSGTVYNALPQNIQNAILDTTVVSGHGCHDNSNIVTTDKLFILGLHEVFEDGGESTYIQDNDTAYSVTRQLDYYHNNGQVTLLDWETDEFENIDKLSKTVFVNMGDSWMSGEMVEDWTRTPVIRDGDCEVGYDNAYYFRIEYAGGELAGGESRGGFGDSFADRDGMFVPAFRI